MALSSTKAPTFCQGLCLAGLGWVLLMLSVFRYRDTVWRISSCTDKEIMLSFRESPRLFSQTWSSALDYLLRSRPLAQLTRQEYWPAQCCKCCSFKSNRLCMNMTSASQRRRGAEYLAQTVTQAQGLPEQIAHHSCCLGGDVLVRVVRLLDRVKHGQLSGMVQRIRVRGCNASLEKHKMDSEQAPGSDTTCFSTMRLSQDSRSQILSLLLYWMGSCLE